jgi:type IV secretory pathway VirB4 component
VLRVPTIAVTTRHSPSLYPWQCSPGLSCPGPLIGLDRLADAALFACDPWELYAAGVITSPNMLVLGQIGTGKSALVKTYLRRQLLAGRQVAVLDPKGEYAALAEDAGLTHVALAPGGADRLNPLDPPPGESPDGVARHRAALVAALAASGLGRDLQPEERAALTAAVSDIGVDAVLGDVVGRLLEPDDNVARCLATTPQSLAAAVRPLALELRRLLDGDLGGMLDETSTVTLDADGPGLVVDVSAVFGTEAIGPVMTCVGAWLSRVVARGGGRQRILVVDEAWALLGRVGTTRWLQSVAKLARTYGVQLVVVTHRLSDLTAQADAGTESERQALGLLSDTDIRVVYRQPVAERDAAARLLGLTTAEADLVTRLPAHRALWKIGRHIAVVDHLLATDDGPIVDTDARMQS